MPKQLLTPRMVRRSGAEMRINLRRWRRWYADDDGDEDDGADPQSDGQQDDGQVSLDDLPVAIQQYIKELRQESANYRAQAKQHAERLSAIEKANRKKLEEEGNYKALLDQTNAEVESLKSYKERAEALDAIIREGNEAMIQRVPEDRRGIVPVDYPPEKLRAWLDKNVPLLTKQPPPDFDAGAGAGGRGRGGSDDLTPYEKRMAQKFNLKPEAIKAAREKMAESSFEIEDE